MSAETDKIKSRAKQRAQQIQQIQAGDKGWPLEDLGSPAEDETQTLRLSSPTR